MTEVRARIVTAETVAGRHGAGVKLLVATKSWDAASAAAAVNAGARLVGESRMQELEVKANALKAAGARIHVIGQLQRNKAQIAVRYADCVQTIDSIELAERLDRLCTEAGRTLDVMIQEPLPAEHWMWLHPGVTLTPHVSGMTLRGGSVSQAVRAVQALQRGDVLPGHVDRERGY